LQTAGKPAEEIAVSVDIRPTVYEHRTDESRTSSSSWSGQRHVLICADGYIQTAQIKRLRCHETFSLISIHCITINRRRVTYIIRFCLISIQRQQQLLYYITGDV